MKQVPFFMESDHLIDRLFLLTDVTEIMFYRICMNTAVSYSTLFISTLYLLAFEQQLISSLTTLLVYHF